jgi:hypothetical protein
MTALRGEEHAPREAASRSATGVGMTTEVEGCAWCSHSISSTTIPADRATRLSRPTRRGETALGKSTRAVVKPGGVTMVHRGGIPLSLNDSPC